MDPSQIPDPPNSPGISGVPLASPGTVCSRGRRWEHGSVPGGSRGELRCPVRRAAAVTGLGSADAGLVRAGGRGRFYTTYVQMQRI